MTSSSSNRRVARWMVILVVAIGALGAHQTTGATARKKSKNVSARTAARRAPVAAKTAPASAPKSASRAPSSERIARVVSVNGSASTAERSLKPGDAVRAGETIRTADGSGVKLLLPGETVVDAGPKTTLAIHNSATAESPLGQGSEVRLDFGTVRASIQKKLDKKSKFLIRTKSSVLSARGTEFTVKSELNGTVLNESFVVGDGKVEVTPTNGAPFVLNPGQQATGSGQFVSGQFRAPASNSFQTENITPQQVKESLASATVVDQTFQQAVVIAKNSEGGGFSGQGTMASIAPTLAKPQIKAANGANGPALTPPTLGRLREFAGSAAEQNLKTVKVTVVFDPS